MWAVAHIVHHLAYTQSRLDTPWSILVFGAAIVLIQRPASGRWLAVMASAQLLDAVVEMPYSADHLMLLVFADLALLIAMAVGRSYSVSTAATGFPAIRAVLIIAYGAAAVSKYNLAFLEPVTSCANAIAGVASFGLSRSLDVGSWIAPVVLVLETCTPILLAIPATRRHGVRLAMSYHFVFSLSPAFAVVDFTTALYALFLLFLPHREVDRVLDSLGSVGRRSAVVRDAARHPGATSLLAFVVLGFGGYANTAVLVATVFVFSQIYLLLILGAALRSWPGSSEPPREFGRVRWVFVPVLGLTLLWALSPYLGLRTTASFTMFSGLKTEGTESNHLFMPVLRLTEWQDDLVVIRSSNSEMLNAPREAKVGIPLLALRRIAMDDPGLKVTGEMRGEPMTFGPGPDQTRLEPLPYWQYKFLLFRPVAVEEAPFCSIS